MLLQHDRITTSETGFSLAGQYFRREKICKCPFHEGALLAWAKQLIARNSHEKLHQVLIEVGGAYFDYGRFSAGQPLRERDNCSHSFSDMRMDKPWLAREVYLTGRNSMFSRKFGVNPWLYFPACSQACANGQWNKLEHSLKKQLNPRPLSHKQAPDRDVSDQFQQSKLQEETRHMNTRIQPLPIHVIAYVTRNTDSVCMLFEDFGQCCFDLFDIPEKETWACRKGWIFEAK